MAMTNDGFVKVDRPKVSDIVSTMGGVEAVARLMCIKPETVKKYLKTGNLPQRTANFICALGGVSLDEIKADEPMTAPASQTVLSELVELLNRQHSDMLILANLQRTTNELLGSILREWRNDDVMTERNDDDDKYEEC